MLNAQNKGRQHVKATATRSSGWGGIRTPVGLAPKAVFKTAAFDHSATHPNDCLKQTLSPATPQFQAY